LMRHVATVAISRRQHQPVDRGKETKILVKAPGVAIEGVHGDRDMAGSLPARPHHGGFQQLSADALVAPVGSHHEIVEFDHLVWYGAGKSRRWPRQQYSKAD